MSTTVDLASKLDLKTAWFRVKEDVTHDRNFVRHPYEQEVIEFALDEWLESLRSSLSEGRYHARAAYICEMPKAGGGIRPGALLCAEDRVIYTAAVGACIPQLHSELRWAAKDTDFAYRLAKLPSDPKWLQNQFRGWDDFRKRSLEIAQNNECTLFTDITGFYENIDIGTLVSDLKSIGVEQAIADLLSACLNRWAQIPGRGIPQGMSASDILAKLYLNTVDENLVRERFAHVRYVDDVRIFCKSELDAKKAIILLSRLLRARGLNLQSAKSEILTQENTVEKIEAVSPIIAGLASKYVEEFRAAIGNPYASVSEVDEYLSQNPSEAPLELLEGAYREYFLAANKKFDRTLFRFLLNRLGRSGSAIAEDHVFELLETHPEETATMTKYLGALKLDPKADKRIASFLTSESAIYPYQNYQLLSWVSQRQRKPAWELLDVARQSAMNLKFPRYLRAVCRKILGDYGTPADLELLLSTYQEISDSLEQVEIMCSLRRMERGKRNSFLARCESDGELNRAAGRIVRAAHN